ncbi:MAG TPA: flagellar basal body P-ring formation protein FlgA, partial [Methylophilaceae bacterium]|nr:flagellar basal body P-ring formation protein FlgA [Methylophilaceae bacterium]
MYRKRLPKLALSALLLAVAAAPCIAAAAQLPRQDLAVLRQKAEAFLTTQSQGYPGQVKISVGAIDPNLQLAQCAAPDVFMPAGSRAWGKTSVGVRCTAPASW